MRILKAFFVSTSLLFGCCIGHGQKVLQVDSLDYTYTGKYIEYFIDSSNKLGINEVIQLPFTGINDDVPNFGILSYPVWMKITLRSLSAKELFLTVMAPLMEHL